MRIYKPMPANLALKDRAKALRKAGVLHEVILWQHLKNKQLNNLDFDRQKIIGNYIVDFYCPAKSVVIEVDGASHDHKQPTDAARDAFLAQLNVQVMRIAAHDVLNNINSVIEFLQQHPALQFPSCREG